MRKCHSCREGIADADRVCPHCGFELVRRARGAGDNSDARGLARFITHGPTRLVVQGAALFVVLVGVYGVYLHGAVSGMAVQSEWELSELMWPLAKYCLISGAPFALLASLDHGWKSEHAAPVALVAWVVVFHYISSRTPTCPKTFAFLFVPLVSSALAAHTIVRTVSGGAD